LDKLKGPDQPYPKLQSKSDFDSDYVKDENSDKGAWAAQFEYDALRKKLVKEENDEKRAQGKADSEAKDESAAQKAADEAGKNANAAKKDADAANAGEGSAKTAEDFGGPPSAKKLEELKKAVAEAQANYAKEKKDFEECQKQLEKAKANLEELKKTAAEMEAKLAGDTKLWVEQKTMKLNVEKSRQDAAAKTHQSKMQVAQAKLAVAEKAKAEVDAKLAKEKAEHEKAQKSLQKEQAEMKQAKADLEAAASKLQKLRGYKPAQPTKIGATMASAVLSILVVAASQLF